jgi:hypothetical protein
MHVWVSAAQVALAQSLLDPQMYPPGSAQMPPLQTLLGQSDATPQAVHRLAEHRPLPQEALSAQGSPFCSLQ